MEIIGFFGLVLIATEAWEEFDWYEPDKHSYNIWLAEVPSLLALWNVRQAGLSTSGDLTRVTLSLSLLPSYVTLPLLRSGGHFPASCPCDSLAAPIPVALSLLRRL